MCMTSPTGGLPPIPRNVAIPWKQLSVLGVVVVVVLFRVVVVVHGVRQRCATHCAGAGQSALMLQRCSTCGIIAASAGGGSGTINNAPVVTSGMAVVTVTGCDSDVDVCESPSAACDFLSAALEEVIVVVVVVVAAVGIVNVRSVG